MEWYNLAKKQPEYGQKSLADIDMDAWRRDLYEEDKEKISTQKRANYAEKKASITKGKTNIINAMYKCVDVTKEYLDKATPGEGKVEREAGYIEKQHEKEIKTAEWLYNTFGGNIILLRDNGIELSPDYNWNGSLWDLKNPETINPGTIEKRISHGLKQIAKNPGGIIADFSKSELSIGEAEKTISEFIDKRMKTTTDIIIKKNENYKVVRYKNDATPPHLRTRPQHHP